MATNLQTQKAKIVTEPWYNNLDNIDLDENIKVEINSFYKKELQIKKINDIVDFKTTNLK